MAMIEQRVEVVEERIDRLEALFGQFMTRTGIALQRIDRAIERMEAARVKDREENARLQEKTRSIETTILHRRRAAAGEPAGRNDRRRLCLPRRRAQAGALLRVLSHGGAPHQQRGRLSSCDRQGRECTAWEFLQGDIA